MAGEFRQLAQAFARIEAGPNADVVKFGAAMLLDERYKALCKEHLLQIVMTPQKMREINPWQVEGMHVLFVLVDLQRRLLVGLCLVLLGLVEALLQQHAVKSEPDIAARRDPQSLDVAGEKNA